MNSEPPSTCTARMSSSRTASRRNALATLAVAREQTLAHCSRVRGHTARNSLWATPSMHTVMWSNCTPKCLSRGFHRRACAAARPSQNEHGRACPRSTAQRRMRPTVASLSARSGQRAAKSGAILAFPAHGVSRRMRTTRMASALVQRRPGWLRGRLLRGTSPATPPSSKRRRHAQ